MMPRRDRNLASVFSGRHKATPPLLEASLNDALKRLAESNAYTVGPFMQGGVLSDLAAFGARNSAATGFLLHRTFYDAFLCSNDIHFVGMEEMCAAFRKSTYTLLVEIKVSNTKTLTASFDSDTKLVQKKEGGSTTKTYTQSTGYGVEFDCVVHWKLMPATADAGPKYEAKWKDHVHVEPKKSQHFPFNIVTPDPAEFSIGEVLNLLHARESRDCADLGIPESGATFPRRNPRVQAIEAALQECKRLADYHMAFLSKWFAGATTRNSRLDLPWSLSRWERKKDAIDPVKPAEVFGADLAQVLREHHEKEHDLRIMGLGASADLLQTLTLLRSYCAHFLACYESIDHVMVRSFLQGVGAHNAMLFEEYKSLDGLLMKIGKHQMQCAGLKTKAVGVRTPGCSLSIKIELPEKRGYFQTLEGLPCVDDEHAGMLCFYGATEDGIPTVGTSTRYVSQIPVESAILEASGEAQRPTLRLDGFTDFEGKPVVAAIGSPDGAKTYVHTAFLFGDMWYLRYALSVSFIPSNAAFDEATAALPPEMASFASAIRAMDVATSGFCVEIVELSGALADAIGVREGDLAGDSAWLKQLVMLMRGGASLQSISKKSRKQPSAAQEDFVDVGTKPTAHELAQIKAATQGLYDRMIAQGKVDHYEPPPDKEPEDDDEEEDDSSHMVYRSCGSSDEPAAFRSLGAKAAPAAPPAPAATPAAPAAAEPMSVDSNNAAPGEGGEGGDSAVDELAGEVDAKLKTKDVGVNFMQRMLDALNKISEPKAAVGAKIEAPDPVKHIHFAKAKCPDGVKTNDKAAPPESEWEPCPALDGSTASIVELLSNCTAPIRTERFTLFLLGAAWDSNVLTGLMSGSRDPSKVQLEIAQAIAPMQQA